MFYVRADLSSGSYSVEHDFGEAGEVDCTMMVDAEELADTTYQATFFTRETETDFWQDMGGVGSVAVDTNAFFSFKRFRYVRVDAATTGSTPFESGVVGF